MKKIKKVLTIPQFPNAEIQLLLAWGDAELRIQRRPFEDREPDWVSSGCAYQFKDKDGYNIFAISLHVKRLAEGGFLLNTATHESSHLTTYIMDTYDIKDDEFRSYTVGWLTQELYNLATAKGKK